MSNNRGILGDSEIRRIQDSLPLEQVMLCYGWLTIIDGFPCLWPGVISIYSDPNSHKSIQATEQIEEIWQIEKNWQIGQNLKKKTTPDQTW